MSDRRSDRHRKFGRARTERDNRQADDEGRDFALTRDPRASVHKPIRTLDEKRKPQDEQKDIQSQHTL